MKILSLDCSTTRASMALLNGDSLVAETTWFEERARHEGLFDAGAKLMAGAGWPWDEIELFTVGRGPGAYSGLRVSLLAVQAWAAPGRKPVVAVSSMEAAAMEILARENLPELLVMGDARRNSYWYGRVKAADLTDTTATWHVVDKEHVASVFSPGSVAATPHPEALQALQSEFGSVRWLEAPVVPTAVAVARLARLRMESSLPPEQLAPLYMHAAV